MSALVLTERPLRLWDDPAGRRPRDTDAPSRAPGAPPADHPEGDLVVGDGPTLADVLASAWEGLAAHATVACPVCHGELEPHGSGGGRCRSCGTTLS